MEVKIRVACGTERRRREEEEEEVRV